MHRPVTLLQNSLGLKIIDGVGDCGVLAILFSILSGGSTIQKKIGQNVYDCIRNFDKAFQLKEPVTEMNDWCTCTTIHKDFYVPWDIKYVICKILKLLESLSRILILGINSPKMMGTKCSCVEDSKLFLFL